jgi:hypothetical protein
MILEAISKIHLTSNYGVADLLKMLTEESELNPPQYFGGLSSF